MITSRWRELRRLLGSRLTALLRAPDTGYISEFSLTTALMIAGGVTILAIVVAKIIARVQGMPL